MCLIKFDTCYIKYMVLERSFHRKELVKFGNIKCSRHLSLHVRSFVNSYCIMCYSVGIILNNKILQILMNFNEYLWKPYEHC